MDSRIVKLAKNIVHYSCELKAGEKVLVQAFGTESLPLLRQIVKEVHAVGAIPFVETHLNTIRRELFLGANEEYFNTAAEVDALMMSKMDAYVGIRGDQNPSELSDVPPEKMGLYQKLYFQPVHTNVRLHKKWVVMNYPSYSMAQAMDTSFEAFEDFFFQVCNLDYAKMSAAMDKLTDLLTRTDKVRITGPGTDISFSVKGIPPIKCDGKFNIPDGEVFTAPVRDSVNGIISYNTPSRYQGFVFDNVVLKFENGKIIEATANNTELINKILNADEGARYVGEFAIGVNPYINKPMLNTLFDEKIAGSIHFTPGNAYDWAFNGNRSAIHWDLVLIQTPEFGGGEIYFDDVLIRKDGLFVTDELKGLNPDNY
ncbi:MAG: aminopeptidase [Clostridiales bacterium]|jgi:aminopeptidase|nr:aminopeptidase [Clostridiales bacterium]